MSTEIPGGAGRLYNCKALSIRTGDERPRSSYRATGSSTPRRAAGSFGRDGPAGRPDSRCAAATRRCWNRYWALVAYGDGGMKTALTINESLESTLRPQDARPYLRPRKSSPSWPRSAGRTRQAGCSSYAEGEENAHVETAEPRSAEKEAAWREWLSYP
ncbi:hypothetical protein THAOC_22656 [Thalassiosira oceanica]|uniref:Uncharacterized protein n=1 Tax=Thalassiosira oceanica TaxID=159749 RepID=K0RXX3_THAOC|nr:hypothetical protein THAOC_22656 [Thalassiosira oceanica]|eukprot:EJK57314.1 hypothetical protein THAOC_22656 [Thalassiosira oceanica]